MKRIWVFLISLFYSMHGNTRSVGIGAISPHDKAILDISSNNKGVLFSRMKTEDRDSTRYPPDGLHIFNTDDRSLNYFVSVYGIRNCYKDECKTVMIHVSGNACNLDFYNVYAKSKPAFRYLVVIEPGITHSGYAAGDTALSFVNMPVNAAITFHNYGSIYGAGGSGGNDRTQKYAFSFPCSASGYSGTSGSPGGHAIATRAGVHITVSNYGIVAG